MGGRLLEMELHGTRGGVVDHSHAGWVDGDTILLGCTVGQVQIFRGAD